MYNFFTVADKKHFGEFVVPVWNQLKPNLNAQISTIELYCRNNNFYASSHNFFVRLLQSISVPKMLSTERYVANVKEMAFNFSMAMGMTSSIYKGKLFSNVLYGEGSTEVIIAVDSDVNYLQAVKDWQNIRAVKVARHFRNDLTIAPLDGKNVSPQSGICVLMVDVALLAVQYRAFVLDEYRKLQFFGASQYSAASIQHFVYRYVFVGALRSHFDIAIMNRFNAILTNSPVIDPIRKMPLGLPRFDFQLHAVLEKVADGVIADNKSLREYISYIPAISSDSQYQGYMMPEVVATRQVEWALNLCVEKPFEVYMAALRGGSGRGNGAMLTGASRLIRQLQRDNAYQQILPTQAYIDFKNTITSFLSLSN